MPLSVESSRIERLIEALAAASIDRFDAPEAEVDVVEDEFGELETAFRLFLAELREAKESLEGAVASAQAAQAEAEKRLATIEQQRLTIRELSTPVLEVWEDVVVLPIVGAIDTQRAVDMTESLLEFIVRRGTRIAIVDLTGVEVVDTSTADHLGRLIRATALLGSRCIVTGIGPSVATTLVELGIPLAELETMRTLGHALRACLSTAD